MVGYPNNTITMIEQMKANKNGDDYPRYEMNSIHTVLIKRKGD